MKNHFMIYESNAVLGGRRMSLRENAEQFIDMLASHLHDEWRKGRLQSGIHGQSDARYDPRMKPTGLPSGGEVDIANTPYSHLPPKWQGENKAQASAVVNSIMEKIQAGQAINRLDVEELSDVVHKQWMQRNSWAQKDSPQLFVAYKDLPEEEKEKDRVVVRQGIKILQGASGGN